MSDKERPEHSKRPEPPKPFEDLETRNFGLLDLHAIAEELPPVAEELPPVEIQDTTEAEPSAD